jgi:RecA/RadA recombinase
MTGNRAMNAAVEAAISSARARGNGTEPPPQRKVEILTFADMVSAVLDEERSLVAGMVETQSIAMIYGESGCGKTFLALDLALSIASGREWFGRACQQARAIYIAAEAGRSIRHRVAAWAADRWDGQGDVNFAAVVSPVDLCDKKGIGVKQLVAAIKEAGGANLVIIDTVSRALAGGDENSPDAMGLFVKSLDYMRSTLGCAVIVVHHVGKDASRGGRGHSLLHCAVDTEMEVVRKDGGICTASVTKQRDMPEGDAVAFRLRQVELGRNRGGQVLTSCVVEQLDWAPAKMRKGPTGHNRAALDALAAAIRERAEPIPRGEGDVSAVTFDCWREFAERGGRLGASGSSSFRSAWKRAHQNLIEKGLVGHSDSGRVWLST